MNRPVPPGQPVSCRTNLFAVGVPRCIVKVRFLIPVTTGLGFTPGRSISRILCCEWSARQAIISLDRTLPHGSSSLPGTYLPKEEEASNLPNGEQ